MILPLLQQCSRERLPELLDNLVAVMGERDFCREAANQMIAATRPERVLPPALARFAPLLTEGLTFFLSHISSRRLRAVICDLAAHAAEAGENDRLFQLALRFPTLHKLGQIIARKPGVDPRIKDRLVQLEQGDYGTSPDRLVERINNRLAAGHQAGMPKIIAEILAEASVAAVIPFGWDGPENRRPERGVFKILKPEVREHVAEELQAIDKTAAFLEKNRLDLGLGQMRVSAVFQELRLDLEKEIDLAAEQEKLVEAARLYGGDSRVHIPRILPFCSREMTAMEHMAGRHVTEADIPPEQRAELADLVFTSLLCRPLFAEGEQSLFHGDPHGGNILAVAGTAGSGPEIALLDWALSGYLGREQRLKIMQLLLAVLNKDGRTLSRTIESLAADNPDDRPLAASLPLQQRIEQLIAHPEYLEYDPLKRVFWLLDQVMMLGVAFPSELILYRKAFFTLDGVLHDISPGFSMAESMEGYLNRLLLRELPLRYAVSLMPMLDDASLYRTLLSNADLCGLLSHRLSAGWQKAMAGCSAIAGANLNLAGQLFFVLPGKMFFGCLR